jgi:YtkA-like
MEKKMKKIIRTIAAACLITLAAPVAAFAAAADYVFEPVQATVKNGSGSDIAVKLIHKSTGKPVEGAVIIRTRLDMSPENMATMTTRIEPFTETGAGIYKSRADFTMAGKWALKLQAKVQGEADTVEGTVVFTAAQ